MSSRFVSLGIRLLMYLPNFKTTSATDLAMDSRYVYDTHVIHIDIFYIIQPTWFYGRFEGMAKSINF